MKQLILAIFLVILASYAFAAAPVVENVAATFSSGQVTITYNLTADGICKVTLMVSNDGGSTYNIYPTAVSGDIGNSVPKLPVAKTMIWTPAGDGMVAGTQYKVKVIARDNPVEDATQVQSFIKVAGGTFNNGTSDVTLSSFFMDKYETTQADYEAVMGVNPSWFTGVTNGPVERVSWFNAIEYCNRRSLQEGLTPCYSYNNSIYNNGADYGTNPATWPGSWNSDPIYQFHVYCSWTANGYRLPTEMEWQFAAQGGNSTHNYTYSGSNDINVVAWWGAYYSGNSGYTANTVGTLAANELGIFDMSGNVWEWNWDLFDTYPSGAQTNPHNDVNGWDRMYRGGSWSDAAYSCKISVRNMDESTDNSYMLGFRCVRISP